MIDEALLSSLTALVTVVIIDIVLAGDNALVVGLAAAGLPPAQRRRAIMIGVGLALVARIVFALLTTRLLEIIGLLLAGGLLLLWVAWRMWRDLKHLNKQAGGALLGEGEAPAAEAGEAAVEAGEAENPASTKSYSSAVTQIAIADISMSLDNVLAVAGAAHEHPWTLVFGLALSIALMGIAAGFIARYMEKHPWLGYLGVVVVTWVALSMIWDGAYEVFNAV